MKLLLITCLFFLPFQLFSQQTKEEQFVQTVEKVIRAFSQQDSSSLAKLVNADVAIYYLYKGNTFLNIVPLTGISFTQPGRFGKQLRDCNGIHSTVLQYTKLPKFDCDKEVWTMKGLFVDTTIIDHKITKGIDFKNKYEPGSYNQKMIKRFKSIEVDSRRIILQDGYEKELVFYLTWIKNKWFLTIIDKASSDCSV